VENGEVAEASGRTGNDGNKRIDKLCVILAAQS